MAAFRRKRGRWKTGQALVELALVFPIFVIFLFCLIDFAYAIFVYNTLYASVREGTRLAALNDPSLGDATALKNKIEDRVIKYAPGLDLNRDKVQVHWDAGDPTNSYSGSPAVTIRVNYAHQTFGPIGWIGDPVLRLRAEMRSAISTYDDNEAVNFASEALNDTF